MYRQIAEYSKVDVDTEVKQEGKKRETREKKCKLENLQEIACDLSVSRFAIIIVLFYFIFSYLENNFHCPS